MNKKRQLLADTFGADESVQFPRNAAACARRRRTMRHASITVGLVASAALFFFTTNRTPLPTPAVIDSSPALEIISDQELMAQFKDQPVVFLKDTSGITEVILLAHHDSGINQHYSSERMSGE